MAWTFVAGTFVVYRIAASLGSDAAGSDLVFPDPFSEDPIRLRDATTIIREYRRATRDRPGTLELTLEFVEAGTEQAADLGLRRGSVFWGVGTADEGHRPRTRPAD